MTYRLVYYLLTIFVAIAILGLHELHLQRSVLKKGG